MNEPSAKTSPAFGSTRIRALAVCWLCGLLALAPAAAQTPPLWGYGVRGCPEVAQACAADTGTDIGADSSELQRYQDWLTGFLSGLNLATGIDVLAGAGIDDALRRVCAHCEREPTSDFFNATMALVRTVGALPSGKDD